MDMLWGEQKSFIEISIFMLMYASWNEEFRLMRFLNTMKHRAMSAGFIVMLAD